MALAPQATSSVKRLSVGSHKLSRAFIVPTSNYYPDALPINMPSFIKTQAFVMVNGHYFHTIPRLSIEKRAAAIRDTASSLSVFVPDELVDLIIHFARIMVLNVTRAYWGYDLPLITSANWTKYTCGFHPFMTPCRILEGPYEGPNQFRVYLVRWMGFDSSHDTWQEEPCLIGRVLSEYRDLCEFNDDIARYADELHTREQERDTYVSWAKRVEPEIEWTRRLLKDAENSRDTILARDQAREESPSLEACNCHKACDCE